MNRIFHTSIVSNYAAQIINTGLTIICFPIYLEFLQLNYLGIWNIVTIIFAWSIFFEFGLPNMLLWKLKLKNKSDTKLNFDNYLFSQLRQILILLNVFLILMSIIIIKEITAFEKIIANLSSWIIYFFAFSVILRVIEVITRQLLIFKNKYIEVNAVIIVNSVVKHSTAIFLFINFPINANIIVLPLILSSITSFVVSQFFLGRNSNILFCKISWSDILWKDLKYALGFWVANIGSLLSMQIDKIILATLVSIESLALYNLAIVPAALVYTASVPFQNAIQPLLLSLYKENRNRFMNSYQTILNSVLNVQIVVFVLIVIFGDFLLLAWLKDEIIVNSIVLIMKLMILANIFGFITGLTFTYASIVGDLKVMSISSFLSPVALIVFIYPLYNSYGLLGFGIAWLLVEVIGLLGYSYFCLGSLNIKYNVILKVLAVGGLMFSISYFVIFLATNLSLTFGIGIGSLLIMGVLYTSYLRVKNIF